MTYHISKFNALMNNMDIATKSTTAALNSQNSAIEENNRHMASIEGKTGVLKNTFTSIFQSEGATKFYKTVLDIANGFLYFIKQVGIGNIALGVFVGFFPQIITGVLALSKIIMALNFSSMLNPWILAAAGVVTLLTVINKLNPSIEEQKQKVNELQDGYNKLNKEVDTLRGKDNKTIQEQQYLDLLERELSLKEDILAKDKRKLAEKTINGEWWKPFDDGGLKNQVNQYMGAIDSSIDFKSDDNSLVNIEKAKEAEAQLIAYKKQLIEIGEYAEGKTKTSIDKLNITIDAKIKKLQQIPGVMKSSTDATNGNTDAVNSNTKSTQDSSKAIEVNKKKVEESNKTYKQSVDDLQILAKAQDELNDKHEISGETLQKLTDKYPELSESVAMYNEGLINEGELINRIGQEYKKQEDVVRESYFNKLMLNSQYYKNLLSSNKELFENLSNAYGIDFNHYSTLAQAKAAVDAKVIEMMDNNWTLFFQNNASKMQKFINTMNSINLNPLLSTPSLDNPNMLKIFPDLTGKSPQEVGKFITGEFNKLGAKASPMYAGELTEQEKLIKQAYYEFNAQGGTKPLINANGLNDLISSLKSNLKLDTSLGGLGNVGKDSGSKEPKTPTPDKPMPSATVYDEFVSTPFTETVDQQNIYDAKVKDIANGTDKILKAIEDSKLKLQQAEQSGNKEWANSLNETLKSQYIELKNTAHKNANELREYLSTTIMPEIETIAPELKGKAIETITEQEWLSVEKKLNEEMLVFKKEKHEIEQSIEAKKVELKNQKATAKYNNEVAITTIENSIKDLDGKDAGKVSGEQRILELKRDLEVQENGLESQSKRLENQSKLSSEENIKKIEETKEKLANLKSAGSNAYQELINKSNQWYDANGNTVEMLNKGSDRYLEFAKSLFDSNEGIQRYNKYINDLNWALKESARAEGILKLTQEQRQKVIEEISKTEAEAIKIVKESYINYLNEALDEETKKLEKNRDIVKETSEDRVRGLEEQKKALEDTNKSLEEQEQRLEKINDIEKQRQKISNIEAERNVKIFKDGKWEDIADPRKLREENEKLQEMQKEFADWETGNVRNAKVKAIQDEIDKENEKQRVRDKGYDNELKALQVRKDALSKTISDLDTQKIKIKSIDEAMQALVKVDATRTSELKTQLDTLTKMSGITFTTPTTTTTKSSSSSSSSSSSYNSSNKGSASNVVALANNANTASLGMMAKTTTTNNPFFEKYDTGGYTGDWESSEGKLAVLHEKELVLNKQDTPNLLSALNMSNKIINLVSSITPKMNMNLATPSGETFQINGDIYVETNDATNFITQLKRMVRS